MTGLRPDGRTRGAADGMLRMPKDHRNVFLGNMVKIWNKFPALAAAKTASMARTWTRTELKKALPV